MGTFPCPTRHSSSHLPPAQLGPPSSLGQDEPPAIEAPSGCSLPRAEPTPPTALWTRDTDIPLIPRGTLASRAANLHSEPFISEYNDDYLLSSKTQIIYLDNPHPSDTFLMKCLILENEFIMRWSPLLPGHPEITDWPGALCNLFAGSGPLAPSGPHQH